MREIWASFDIISPDGGVILSRSVNVSGAFYRTGTLIGYAAAPTLGSGYASMLSFSSSLVVPTGSQNSPETSSSAYWVRTQ